MSEKNLNNEKNEDNSIPKDRKSLKVNDKHRHLDLRIYNELDDFASEVLSGDEFVKYVEARREYLFEPEESVKKYLGEEYWSGNNDKEKIETFADFYYQYLVKYSNSYFYEFMSKGFTDGFRELLKKNEIDPDTLDVNWDSIRSKELEDITKKEMKLIKKCRMEDSLAYKIASSKTPEEITEKEMKLIKKHGYEFLLSDEFRKQIKKEMTKNLEKKK